MLIFWFCGTQNKTFFFNDKINNLIEAITDNRPREEIRENSRDGNRILHPESLFKWLKQVPLSPGGKLNELQMLKASDGFFYFTDSTAEQPRKIWGFFPKNPRGK